ncbi:reverse transcriptase-like protein [Granulicella sibirica]|uniref:Phosphoglycerate mutase family n=1 Tax=Granulicella sibirica TaxID=2479048 RepID=A0A4Q0T6L1_9BACT|nr:reverse transcriptase-like protein [Granulicella sibirica]RXH57738.1 Phosphoglycerate mutase family [Granulicella sibirica]
MPSRTPSSSLFGDPAPPSRVATQGTWINAHCDGGARGNPGPAGYGALIQDDSGMVVAELSEFLGLKTNNFAEYSGLLGCLAYALEHGHARLRVVSDSELMVKQIQGKYQVKSPDLKPLYEEAKRRIAKLDGFEISHALRHKNKDADRLANEAMDRGMKRPHAAGQPAPAPLKATPYPSKAETPVEPRSFARPAASAPVPVSKADTMLRGFTRDGVVHVLGGTPLPDGIFVKIIRE